MSPLLPIRSKLSPPFQASKWLTCPLLLDEREMKALLEALGEFWIFRTSGVLPIQEGEIKKEEFLAVYQQYIEALKRGGSLSDPRLRSYFSAVFTTSLEALYEVHLNDQQKLIKVDKPVVQLQSHRVGYSSADGKFRSLVMGEGSLEWGIQFSFPQLYQDAAFQVKQVRDAAEFPNLILFKRIQKWVRDHTVATPFLVEGKRVNVPIRLGKECFSWINHHPQLRAKGLAIINLYRS